MATEIPILGGEVRRVKFRLSEDSYFKCAFRYRVYDENTGEYDWADWPVGTDLKIMFQTTPADITWPVTSIVGQYARFIIDPADVNAVMTHDPEIERGQLWFDDGTGFDLAASGTILEKE